MFKTLLPVALALSALPAWGTTTFYVGSANEAAFNSAAGSLTYVSFGDYAGLLPATTLTETITGVTFAGFIGNNTSAINLTLSGTQLATTTASNGSTYHVDLPNGVQIIAMHLRLAGGTAGNFCIEAPGTTGCGNSLLVSNGSTEFLGIITDDLSLADFQFRKTTGSGAILAVMDVAVGSAAAEAPEPATMALMGAALISLTLTARRRRRP